MKLIHNPRCSKSRDAVKFLTDRKIDHEVILYMKDGLTTKEIKTILKQLNMKAEDLIRKTEKTYIAEYKGKTLSEAQWIKAMVDEPKLIQRPILINKDKAAVGRPIENFLDIL